MNEFTKDGSNTRVLLLNIAENASGLNLIEATHIILMGMLQERLVSGNVILISLFLLLLFFPFFIVSRSLSLPIEPIQGRDAKSVEAQAIGRAHRQGQSARVTVVRYLYLLILLSKRINQII